MLRNNSKVAVVAEVSLKYTFLSLICDLKCFAFVLLCLIFAGAAAGVGQIDSTNSVMAQRDNASDQSLNNNINLSSSMSQTNEPGNLGSSNDSQSTEN